MSVLWWVAAGIGILIFTGVLASAAVAVRRRKRRAELHLLTNDGKTMDVDGFLKHRERMLRHDPSDFPGVYIIHNTDKDRYYVGQSVHVLKRVHGHFTGHGNGDVYADLKYGTSFTVRLEALEGSGYHSLDDLERVLIRKYDAWGSGYNKTRGNG